MNLEKKETLDETVAHIKEMQIEALQTVHEYLMKLIPSMEEVIGELTGEKKDDTEEYLFQVIEGLNWVIEIFNGTSSLINEKSTVMEKEKINQEVLRLSDAMISKNYEQAATILDSGILPFLNELKQISGMYVNNNY
ncbi:MAG: hypothetical protein GX567_13905 [Clostridia bacterium]|nr:hypothetical protein [Clostridia bacterium]